jgi:hypothetical protein
MTLRVNPNQLVVEGHEDKFAIANLLSRWVHWGDTEVEWPAKIFPAGGIDLILDRDRISSRLKSSGLQRLGFVLDADADCDSRWQSIRNSVREHYADFPESLDPNGSIYVADDGLRIGVWIMPDNRSAGMLETLLKHLVPSDGIKLSEYARESALKAREMGARYKEIHFDKSILHTWLAWNDPPGVSLGHAVLQSMLDGDNVLASSFVSWFKALYEIE